MPLDWNLCQPVQCEIVTYCALNSLQNINDIMYILKTTWKQRDVSMFMSMLQNHRNVFISPLLFLFLYAIGLLPEYPECFFCCNPVVMSLFCLKLCLVTKTTNWLSVHFVSQWDVIPLFWIHVQRFHHISLTIVNFSLKLPKITQCKVTLTKVSC